MQGDVADLTSQQVLMQIRKCSNETLEPGEPTCHSQAEIDHYVEDIIVNTWVVQSKIDFGKYAQTERPSQDIMEKLSTVMINNKHSLGEETFLRINNIYSQENWLPLFGERESDFYDVSKILKTETDISSYSGLGFMEKVLFSTTLYIDTQAINHKRDIYNLLDLLGDLGGVTEVIMICLGIFINPVSEHSFIIKASKTIFLARSKNKNLFKLNKKYQDLEQQRKYCGMDPEKIPENLKEQIDMHQHIHVEFWQSLRLFIRNYVTERFPNCSCKCCGIKAGKKTDLQKIFYEGKERLEKEFDVVNLIDEMQNFRILYRTYLVSTYREMCINNNKINILNVESSEEISDQLSGHETPHDCHEHHDSEIDFNELEFTLNQKVVDGVILERYICNQSKKEQTKVSYEKTDDSSHKKKETSHDFNQSQQRKKIKNNDQIKHIDKLQQSK